MIYPKYKKIYKKKDLNNKIKKLKKHKKMIIYKKDYILIPFRKNSYWFNRFDILSYYDESNYINFWKNNKDSILKYSKTNNLNDIRNELYYQYNNKNLMYFEETIINLVQIYNSKSVLDIYQRTVKRLLSCCIQNINYYVIQNKNNLKLSKFLIKEYGSKKQKLIKELTIFIKYDLIYVDTEAKEYKNNNEQFKQLMNNLNENGVLIYMYYSKKPEEYKKKYQKVIFNKQIFIVYYKKKLKYKINTNKKTYLILSKYLTSNLFKKMLPDNWTEVNKYNKKIDFVYVDAFYRTYKELNNINKNYNSVVNYVKHDFDDKDYLHKFVKKDNPKIFKKYFMEQYEINTKNISKYKKLFKNNKSWIVKPLPGGAGFGIKVFNSFELMKKYVLKFKEKWRDIHEIKKWVIQKYIDNLLLVNGKKFHIRLNVLNGINDGKSFSKILNRAQLLTAKKK